MCYLILTLTGIGFIGMVWLMSNCIETDNPFHPKPNDRKKNK